MEGFKKFAKEVKTTFKLEICGYSEDLNTQNKKALKEQSGLSMLTNYPIEKEELDYILEIVE
jgi:hypothetical protein